MCLGENMTRQQLLWLFVWIFIFFLIFCIINKLQEHFPDTTSKVQQNINTSIPAKEMHLKFLKDDGSVTISGAVSQAQEKENIIDAYAKVFDEVNASSLLVDTSIQENALTKTFINLADDFATFDSGYIAYHDRTLEIDGQARGSIVKENLDEDLEGLTGIEIHNMLDIDTNQSIVHTSTQELSKPDESREEIQKALDDIVKGNSVQFLYARDILAPTSQKVVNKVVAFLKVHKNAKMEIAGHTDSDGSKKNNLILSQKRAKSIKSYMVNQDIHASRLLAVGYGESEPLVENSSEKNKRINRRVEFKIVGE